MDPSYSVEYSESITAHFAVYRDSFPASLWPRGELRLPLRRLTNDLGIALLITSGLDHEVYHLIISRLAERIKVFQEQTGVTIDGVAGIAKLGYGLAQGVSERLGHEWWIPIDSGRKLWYSDELSASAGSVTSSGEKYLFLDPYMVDRVSNRIMALVDDAFCTGHSAVASVLVLKKAGAERIICFPVFSEGHEWERNLRDVGIPKEEVITLGHLPMFRPVIGGGGWSPITETL